MKRKLPQYTWISILLALLLQRIIYAIAGFNFSRSPLFSLYSLCDIILFFVYVVIIQYVIIKIMERIGKNNQKK